MRLPVRGYRWRLLTLGGGLLVFLWLAPEDNQVWPPVLLGLLLSALVAAGMLLRRFGGKTVSRSAFAALLPVLGAGVGLATSITAAALMFFKNAMHAHLYPDFPPALMLAILERAPGWALAGGLLGMGLALVWMGLRRKDDESGQRSG